MGHELVRHAERVEIPPNLREVLAAGIAERVADRRRTAENVLDGDGLRRDVVQRAQRVSFRLLAGGVVQVARMLGEPWPEPPLEVRGPACRVADRVQLQVVVGDPEPAKQLVVELDHLGVAPRIVRADRLQVELPELAVPSLLRAAVAVEGLYGIELLRVGARGGVHARGRRVRWAPLPPDATSTIGRRGR